MGEGRDGLPTALVQALEGFEGDAPPEQVSLFPVERLAELPEGANRTSEMRAPRRVGPGRPAGAANKRTLVTRDYLLSQRRDPAMVLADAFSRSVHDLAAELGCTKLEAFDRQIRAAEALMPYLHGKMPVQVQVTGGLPVLMLADPAAFQAAMAGDAGDGLPDLGALKPIQQNQGVIEGQATELDAAELDVSAKRLKNQDDQP